MDSISPLYIDRDIQVQRLFSYQADFFVDGGRKTVLRDAFEQVEMQLALLRIKEQINSTIPEDSEEERIRAMERSIKTLMATPSRHGALDFDILTKAFFAFTGCANPAEPKSSISRSAVQYARIPDAEPPIFSHMQMLEFMAASNRPNEVFEDALKYLTLQNRNLTSIHRKLNYNFGSNSFGSLESLQISNGLTLNMGRSNRHSHSLDCTGDCFNEMSPEAQTAATIRIFFFAHADMVSVVLEDLNDKDYTAPLLGRVKNSKEYSDYFTERFPNVTKGFEKKKSNIPSYDIFAHGGKNKWLTGDEVFTYINNVRPVQDTGDIWWDAPKSKKSTQSRSGEIEIPQGRIPSTSSSSSSLFADSANNLPHTDKIKIGAGLSFSSIFEMPQRVGRSPEDKITTTRIFNMFDVDTVLQRKYCFYNDSEYFVTTSDSGHVRFYSIAAIRERLRIELGGGLKDENDKRVHAHVKNSLNYQDTNMQREVFDCYAGGFQYNDSVWGVDANSKRKLLAISSNSHKVTLYRCYDIRDIQLSDRTLNNPETAKKLHDECIQKVIRDSMKGKTPRFLDDYNTEANSHKVLKQLETNTFYAEPELLVDGGGASYPHLYFEPITEISGIENNIPYVEFSKCGRFLYVSSIDKTNHCIDLDNMKANVEHGDEWMWCIKDIGANDEENPLLSCGYEDYVPDLDINTPAIDMDTTKITMRTCAYREEYDPYELYNRLDGTEAILEATRNYNPHEKSGKVLDKDQQMNYVENSLKTMPLNLFKGGFSTESELMTMMDYASPVASALTYKNEISLSNAAVEGILDIKQACSATSASFAIVKESILSHINDSNSKNDIKEKLAGQKSLMGRILSHEVFDRESVLVKRSAETIDGYGYKEGNKFIARDVKSRSETRMLTRSHGGIAAFDLGNGSVLMHRGPEKTRASYQEMYMENMGHPIHDYSADSRPRPITMHPHTLTNIVGDKRLCDVEQVVSEFEANVPVLDDSDVDVNDEVEMDINSGATYQQEKELEDNNELSTNSLDFNISLKEMKESTEPDTFPRISRIIEPENILRYAIGGGTRHITLYVVEPNGSLVESDSICINHELIKRMDQIEMIRGTNEFRVRHNFDVHMDAYQNVKGDRTHDQENCDVEDDEPFIDTMVDTFDHISAFRMEDCIWQFVAAKRRRMRGIDHSDYFLRNSRWVSAKLKDFIDVIPNNVIPIIQKKLQESPEDLYDHKDAIVKLCRLSMLMKNVDKMDLFNLKVHEGMFKDCCETHYNTLNMSQLYDIPISICWELEGVQNCLEPIEMDGRMLQLLSSLSLPYMAGCNLNGLELGAIPYEDYRCRSFLFTRNIYDWEKKLHAGMLGHQSHNWDIATALDLIAHEHSNVLPVDSIIRDLLRDNYKFKYSPEVLDCSYFDAHKLIDLKSGNFNLGKNVTQRDLEDIFLSVIDKQQFKYPIEGMRKLLGVILEKNRKLRSAEANNVEQYITDCRYDTEDRGRFFNVDDEHEDDENSEDGDFGWGNLSINDIGHDNGSPTDDRGSMNDDSYVTASMQSENDDMEICQEAKTDEDVAARFADDEEPRDTVKKILDKSLEQIDTTDDAAAVRFNFIKFLPKLGLILVGDQGGFIYIVKIVAFNKFISARLNYVTRLGPFCEFIRGISVVEQHQFSSSSGNGEIPDVRAASYRLYVLMNNNRMEVYEIGKKDSVGFFPTSIL